MAATMVKVSGVVAVEDLGAHSTPGASTGADRTSTSCVNDDACAPEGAIIQQGIEDASSAAKVRQEFDFAASTALQSSYQYEHVSVLIVRWADSLDERLHCGEEVAQLKTLFADRFNYNTTVLTLNDKKSPQVQLELGINKLVDEHDGEHRKHLLIVYYSGHGEDRDGHFKIVPDKSEAEDMAKMPDHIHIEADWNRATMNLKREARADVLMIVDACFAGVVAKGVFNQMRIVEALLATGRDGLASGPGPKSFTAALIQVLEELLDKGNVREQRYFNTYDLRVAINRKQNGEDVRVEPLVGPAHASRHIKLVPLAKKPFENPSAEASTLTVRFSFSRMRDLNSQHAIKFAKKLAETSRKQMHEFEISSIEWVDFVKGDLRKSATHMVRGIRAVKKVQQAWRRRKSSNQKRLRDSEDTDTTGEPHESGDENVPVAKRLRSSLEPTARDNTLDSEHPLTPRSTA